MEGHEIISWENQNPSIEMFTDPACHAKIISMQSDQELHKRAFLMWALGVPFKRLEKIPGMPTVATLRQWRYGKLKCTCPWHKWDKLRETMSKEELENLAQESGLDVASLLSSSEEKRVEDELSRFILHHDAELRPLFRRIRNVFGIKTTGRLTGNLHVDMIVTGYLLVLKVRESIVKIDIDDAYQLIQLMRTLVQLFKEWNLPSAVIKEEEESVEIKLVEADKPTPWKIPEEGDLAGDEERTDEESGNSCRQF
jgi:hypothetical protein